MEIIMGGGNMKKVFSAFILVLILSSSGFGANAWIVWRKSEEFPPEKIVWEMKRAYPDYEQCVKGKNLTLNYHFRNTNALKASKENKIKAVDEIYDESDQGFMVIHEGGAIAHYYFCYPDTVDPRK